MKYPEGYYRYFELFNNEEFWESHEVLEEIWRENGDLFLRGLIVFAAGFVHVQKNNPSGCRKVLVKCINWLTPFAPNHWDLDVAGIIAYAQWCIDQLDQLPPGVTLHEQIPFIKLKLEA